MGVPKFTCTNSILEHHARPVFCLKFNNCDPAYKDLLATVGDNKAVVYQCRPGGRVEVLQVYTDADKEEEFFVVAWTMRSGTKAPLLLVAGQKAVLHAIDLSTQALVMSLKGHGKDINDVAVHPTRPHLVLTASQDESVRLWSLLGPSGACVAVFRGEGSHTHQVISLDWHPWRDDVFVSAGMDTSVKIWSLKGIWDRVEKAASWADDPSSEGRAFRAAIVEHPLFSSQRLHGNYVDCVRWLGDLLLSKSVDGRILLTKPEYPQDPAMATSGEYTQLRVFDLPSASMWWVRFSIALAGDLLVAGNGTGRLFLWDPSDSPGGAAQAVLSAKGCSRVVRQTTVSLDGDRIAASCDDGSVWIWEKVAEGTNTTATAGTGEGTNTVAAGEGGNAGTSAGAAARSGGGGGKASSGGGSGGARRGSRSEGGVGGGGSGKEGVSGGGGGGGSGDGSSSEGEQEGTSPDPRRRLKRRSKRAIRD